MTAAGVGSERDKSPPEDALVLTFIGICGDAFLFGERSDYGRSPQSEQSVPMSQML